MAVLADRLRPRGEKVSKTLIFLPMAISMVGAATIWRTIYEYQPSMMHAKTLVVEAGTGEEAVAHHQRSDVCAVPAAGIVAEAMVALVLADVVLEKFGGDSVTETRRNVDSYLSNLRFK